jgi:signal transduction histidine kinase
MNEPESTSSPAISGRLGAGLTGSRGHWPGTGRQWALDAAIAAVVIAAELGGSHSAASWGQHPRSTGHPGALAYLLLAVGGLALLARRRYPVSVLAFVLATTLSAMALGASVIWFALIVAFFTAVLARQRAAAVASLVIGYLASVWPPWRIGRPGHQTVAFALELAAGLAFLLMVSELIRVQRQRTAAIRQSREEERLRRASEERMRMARDLHDVVAHNISVINVQANTALHLMDRQPERARSALVTINEVSKQALVELRSVLGVLRDLDRAEPRTPAPGLASLGDLVDNAAAAGLTVRVEEQGDRHPLPADVDLAAYRIIQEAITNSARHSGSSSARVRLHYDGAALRVEVDDEGRPHPAARAAARADDHTGSGLASAAAAGSSGGNGIAGMTERATALGGTLQAGPRPEGGFRVRALLPVRSPAADDANQGTANHGTANHGTANHGTANHGTADHWTADHGTAEEWDKP